MAKKLLKLTTLLSILIVVLMLTGCPKPEVFYTLTINAENGTVTANPQSETGKYAKDTNVELTANPAAGWVFSKWVINGTDVTGNPTTVKMDADKVVTAVFEEIPPVEYTLTINVTGNGTVAAVPASADNKYEEGTDVQLTPTPAAGWKFVKWVIGGVESTDVPKTVTMNADTTVEAVFEEEIPVVKYTLTVNVTGNGTVAAVPASADNKYEEGTAVQLTPTPADGWEFEKWVIGEVESAEVPKTVTMNADITVGAVFKEIVGPAPKIVNLSLTTEDFMVLQPCTTNLEIRFQVKVDDPDGDLTAAEYIVKHVTSGLFYKVAIPEDNWGAPWIYTISQTTLKNGIGNPIPGGEYEITVTATDANGSSASDSIAFFVKNSLSVLEEVELDIEGSQITIVDGYCLVSEGLPAKVEATISYDSKITARVYLVNTDFVGTLEEMLTFGDLIAEHVFTTESQTTETVIIELPDLMPLMDIGEEYNLVVLLFTPECGALGCVDCGIEDWDVLDCDLVKNPDPYLECLPCECENPCDPCFKGYEPGLLIGNLLVTNPAEFEITLTINETVFTNEDFTFVEDPEDGTLEVRILIEEGMVTPELSGETDLYWTVVTPTDVELDATCTVVIDFEKPEAEIVIENCCVNEGITETTFSVTFSDNVGLQRGKLWVDGATLVLPDGKTPGNWFALSGTEVTVEGTIKDIDGPYTLHAEVEDDYCIVEEYEKECGINVPPLVDFGPWCHFIDCPPVCWSEEIELYWGIVDEQGDFTHFEIVVSHGSVDTYDPQQLEGHVTWTLGAIDCETVTATIVVYDDCEGTVNSKTKDWTSPYPMDNVEPEIELTFADCGEPEECATSAVLAWDASDACLDFVVIAVKQGYLDWPDEGLIVDKATLDKLDMDEAMSIYATTTAAGTIDWIFEDAVDCEYLEAIAIAVDTCGNYSYDELISENVIDNMEPFVALGVFGLGYNALTVGEVIGSEAEFDLDKFIDEGFFDGELCTDATCLMLVWIVAENCVDDVWLTTNYPLNPCGNEIMERPVGNYTYDPKHLSLWWDTFTPEDCYLLDRDVTIGLIPFCLPLIDCDTFEATLTADDISDCTDEVSDYASITVDNVPPETTLEWDLTPCSTEVTLTWSMTDNSFPCTICDDGGCEIGWLDLYVDGYFFGYASIMTDGTTAWYEVFDSSYSEVSVPDGWEIEFDPVTLTYAGTITGEDENLDCVEIEVEFYAFGCCCYLEESYGEPNESLYMVVDNVKPVLEVELPDLVVEPLKFCKDEFTTKNATATIEATVTDTCFDELVVEVTHGKLPNGLKVWTTDVEGFHSLVWDLKELDGKLLDCTEVTLTVTAYDEAGCEPTEFATSFKIDNMPPDITFTNDPLGDPCGAEFVDLDYCIDDLCLTCGDCTTIAVAYIEVSSTDTKYPITAECGCEVPLCGTFRWYLEDIDCGETLVATLVAWDTSGNISEKGIVIGNVDNKAPVVNTFTFDLIDTITWDATDNCFDSISIWVSHGTLPDISVFPQANFEAAQYVPPSFTDQGITFEPAGTTTWDLSSMTAPGTVTMTLAAYDECCNETVVATSFWYEGPQG